MTKGANQSVQVDNPALKTPQFDKIHEIALRQFDNIIIPNQEERLQALSDRRFVFVTGAQWEGEWEEIWANSIKIEVNKTAQGVNDIIDQYKQNRYTVDFRSVDLSEESDAAETLNGMYLADFYRSKGVEAQDNAFVEGVAGGYGAWRLVNRYVDDESTEDNYQVIDWELIVDADISVFWDPNARMYDKSDAAYCYVLSALSKETFIDRFGEDNATEWPQGIWKPFYDWYKPDLVRVAEYYRIVEVKDSIIKLQHVQTGNKATVYKSNPEWRKQLAEYKITGYEETFRKSLKRKECRKWIFSGANNLTEEEDREEGQLIAGGMIPVVPYYGQRWFIDNQERARGHVRLAKDPQRVYNVQISKLTEIAALAPLERPIVAPEQIQGHEDSWADMNVNRSSYALLNPIINEIDGNKIATGPIGKIEPPQIPPVLAQLIQISDNDIKELTNSQDGAGQVKANVSAEAMDVAATRTDDKASLYLDNMRKSVKRAGEIYQAMCKDIYCESDREVPIIKYDQDQNPIHTRAALNSRQVDQQGFSVIANQIGKYDFNVIVGVTEDTATRRDKTVRMLTNMSQFVMAANPELGSIIATFALANMDGEGMHDLQKYARFDLIKKGVITPNAAEQQKLQEQAQQEQQQPPSPVDQLQLSMAKEAEASAQEKVAGAQEKASKVLVNEANAAKLHAEAGHTHVQAVKEFHTPIEQPNTDKPTAKQQSTKQGKSNFLGRFAKLFGR
jgi:hypothetical protein